jgi:DNA-binding transcriptional LysR family regulator
MDRNLITFVVLAETGNMTTAAERLNITQPTLTKRLQQLELHYHCKLFERLPRGVKLTPLGEALLPFARSIKETYLQADEALDAVQSDHLEEIRVGAGPLFHLRYLGKAFETLREEFPNTRIRLTADLNSRNLPSLRSGSLDLVFGTNQYLGPSDHVRFVPLTMVDQGLVVSVDHPLTKLHVVDPVSLQKINWIVYSDTADNEEMMIAYFSSQGLSPPNIVVETTSFSLGLQMVADSPLTMTIPVQLEPILDQSRLKVLQPDPPISRKAAGAFVRNSSMGFPAIARLIEIVGGLVSDN